MREIFQQIAQRKLLCDRANKLDSARLQLEKHADRLVNHTEQLKIDRETVDTLPFYRFFQIGALLNREAASERCVNYEMYAMKAAAERFEDQAEFLRRLIEVGDINFTVGPQRHSTDGVSIRSYRIKGFLNGQIIELSATDEEIFERRDKTEININPIKSSINGEAIDVNQAYTLWERYYKVLVLRYSIAQNLTPESIVFTPTQQQIIDQIQIR